MLALCARLDRSLTQRLHFLGIGDAEADYGDDNPPLAAGPALLASMPEKWRQWVATSGQTVLLGSCPSAGEALLAKSRRETNLVAFCTTWDMRVDEAACRKMYAEHLLPGWVPQYAGPEMWARYVVDMLSAGPPVVLESIRSMNLCIENIPPRLAAALNDTRPGEDVLEPTDLPEEMRCDEESNEIRLTYLRQLEPFKQFAKELFEAIYCNACVTVTSAALPSDSGVSYVSAHISTEHGRVFRVGMMLASRVRNPHIMHAFYMQLRIEERS